MNALIFQAFYDFTSWNFITLHFVFNIITNNVVFINLLIQPAHQNNMQQCVFIIIYKYAVVKNKTF